MHKILIIEDDEIVANIYRNKFAIEGYEAETAPDGQVGLEKMQSFRPDAVLLDLVLPNLNGVEFLEIIRADAEFKNVPVVVFSNTYLSNMVQQAWKAGATKCLSKANCTPKQVIEAVARTLVKIKSGHHRTRATERPHGSASSSDSEFQADLRTTFLENLPQFTVQVRATLSKLIKADTELARLKEIHELFRRIHALTGNAGVAGMFQIAQMADAIEALLKELYEKPKNINASTLRTIASAVDFLGVLFENCSFSEQKEVPQANILVVDDEPISRRAIVYALDKAKLKSVNVEDPRVALQLLTENAFDLVFLDIDMPGMTGLELCGKLRTLPHHKKTPVVFVTCLNDFENRTNSMMRGGNDFIGKPFMFIELAVKALVYVFRSRIEKSRLSPVLA